MKVVILAGGRGTRMGPHTKDLPKPMIPVGGVPLLCHILAHYAAAGIDEALVATGYLSAVVRRYFQENTAACAELGIGNMRVTLSDTGDKTATGGRLVQLRESIGKGTFHLTWGDGLSDVPLKKLLEFHRSHGRLATVTAVRPPARFGYLELDGNKVASFDEKPAQGPGWINGAYFVLEAAALDYIEDEQEAWETGAMVRLAKAGELMAYRHSGFWQCMDVPQEREYLERCWTSGQAPWKTWE